MKLKQLTDGTVQYPNKKKSKKFDPVHKTEDDTAIKAAKRLQVEPKTWDRSDLRAPTPMNPR